MTSEPSSWSKQVNPFAVLATVLPATFMQLLDVSIANLAVPSIQRDLGATYSQIQLVLAGYQLAFACALITGARLGDIYGRKRLFTIGMAGFTLTSAVCGAAPTATVLVAGRILQGTMSAIMFPQVMSVIQVSFAPAERGRAFGLYGFTVSVATMAGPLVGGVLIAASPFGLGWRSVFYINLPIGLAALAAAIRYLPESRAPEGRALDLPGAALITVGLFMLVFPLTEGHEHGFDLAMGAMLTGAVVALASFWLLQRAKTARNAAPLVYTTLLSHRSFRRGLALALSVSSGIPSFFFVLTMYLQFGLEMTPLHAALTTFPFAVGSASAALLSDRMYRRFDVRSLQVGALCMSVAMLAIRTVVLKLGVDVDSWDLAAILLVAGVGLGLILPPMNNIIVASVQPREVGSASGVLATGQQIAASLGLVLLATLYSALLPPAMPTEAARRLGHADALGTCVLLCASTFAASFLILFTLRTPRVRS